MRCDLWSCRKEFDPIGVGLFCSSECSRADWLRSYVITKVPQAYRETDVSKLPQAHLKAAIEWAKEEVESGDPDGNTAEQPHGLMLHGIQTGRGKTRVGTWATSIIAGSHWNGISQHNEDDDEGHAPAGLWLSVGELKRQHLALCRKQEERSDWLSKLLETKVLFIDDVSKVKATPGLLEVLFDVLDTRLHAGRSTIITSNPAGDALAKAWGDEFGPPLVRRLRDLCLCLDFDVEALSNVVPIQEGKTA